MNHVADGTRMAAWLEAAWVDRYLERQLDAEEEAWFESYLIDKADLVDLLEIDTNLRDGLTHARGHGSAAGATRATSAMGPEATPQSWRVPQHTWGRRARLQVLAWAGMAIIALGVGWLGGAYHAAPRLIASPKRVVYDTMRGEPTAPRVEHAESNSPYVLVEVALPAGAQRVRLQLDGQHRDLTLSPDGFASFLVPAGERISDARLSYEINGRSEVQVLQEFP